MPDARLRGLVEHSDALALITEATRGLGVALRVLGLDARPLGTDDADAGVVEPDAVARVAGAVDAAAISRVERLDEPVGYVVAEPSEAAEVDPELVRRVADRTARLLGLLCSREFELDDLSREILDAYEELNLFYDLSGELAGASDLDSVADRILSLAQRAIEPRRGWVVAPDGSGLRLVAGFGLPLAQGTALPPAGLAADALESRSAQVVDCAGVDRGTLGPLECDAEESLLVVPLAVPGRPERSCLGVLVLADRATSTKGALTAADLKLAHALASQAALLLENARLIKYERELELARGIQASLLPEAPPSVAGLDVAGRCRPASNVGGDYYDHVEMPDGRLALVVADVSGHNLSAALMQTATRATLRSAIHVADTPAAMLDRTNRALHADLTRAELFVTAFLGIVSADGRSMAVSDAGHNPTLLFRARTGRVDQVTSGGLPVGVLEDGLYDERHLALEPDDVVVVYTDGLTEARSPDGEELGTEGLARALASVAARSAGDIADALLDAVARFSGTEVAGDDRTLLVLKTTSAGAR